MLELNQDAMSILIKHGKHDLFVKFKCNPLRGEITCNHVESESDSRSVQVGKNYFGNFMTQLWKVAS